ncbi:hypothetical protein ACQKO6_09535 [Pseudomonas monteilii]
MRDILTGKARRVDFVIKKTDGTGVAKEVTSRTASKIDQLLKEERIRDAGGVFVRDPRTKQLIEVLDVSDVVRLK